MRRLLLTNALVLAAAAGAVAVGIASGAARVVGGQTIQVQAAPWTVYVQHQVGSQRFLCTGSVVDASHILTAAHCLYNGTNVLAPPSAFQVRAGVSNYSQPLPTDAEQDRAVSLLRVHPGYVWTDGVNPDDVAVLALATPLDLSGTAVHAVALPSPGASFPAGVAVGVAGFGLQTPTVAASGQLSWMTGTVDAQGDCGDPGGPFSDNAVFLCAASPTSSVCNGDSGSGLVTTGSGTPTLVGVVDGSADCGVGTHALFAYAGVPEILQFIQGNDHPPTAPRDSDSTFVKISWDATRYPVAGEPLTCATGQWSDPNVSVVYSFLNMAGGQVLQSGPKAAFDPPATDVGAKVACEVAVTNSGGTAIAETDPTSPLRPAPAVQIVRVPPLAGTRGRALSVAVTLKSPPGLYGKYSVCLVPPQSVAGKVCRSTVNDDGSPATLPFLFNFRVKPTAPLLTVHVGITAVAGLSTASGSVLLHVSR